MGVVSEREREREMIESNMKILSNRMREAESEII